MTTETRTDRPMGEPESLKIHALKQLTASVVTILPFVLLSLFLMESRIDWPQPTLWALAALVLMCVDFAVLVLLEPYRRKLGDLTIPALLGFISMVMLYVMTESLSRFVNDYGYGWLTPLALVGLTVLYGGAFREKSMALKLFLCLNALALTVLWCLGEADKMSMPF